VSERGRVYGGNPVVKVLRDTWLIFQQEAGLMARSPAMIAITLAQPITYLLLFAPLLKVVLAGHGASSYGDAYRIYVPGLFVSMGLFGGLFAGYGLLQALRSGVIDRCRVTAVSRVGLLLGRALMHVALIVVQSVVITVAALPLGLRVDPVDVLITYLMLAMMVLMTTSVSYDIALTIRNPNALGTTINTFAQPIFLLAGIVIPIALAPLWIRDAALWNPFAWATIGMRALFAGRVGDPAVWRSALIIAVLTVATVAWSARLFNREVS
jgi:ABC-2 type transport system permease protein